MININNDQLKKIKDFIFNNGRLLERKLYSFFFENGQKDDVIKCLISYQNTDGGFGNGIEPDLLCPDSTAIGAETALYTLDLLEITKGDIVNNLIKWILNVQNDDGYISHPPKNMYNYPYQEWWGNPDDKRIFALAGYLKKWGFNEAFFFEKVKNFYSNSSLPEEFTLYNYPYFIYLKYLGRSQKEKSMLQHITNQLSSIFNKNKEHYPLFGRHWYHALDIVDKQTIKNEAENFFRGIKDDGGLKIVYQNLPWWRPIWTLDGLILLKKFGILEF
ncbi:MAG: hypothetical protein ACXAEX_14825 [Promethearchaeota archaeon]